MSETIFRKMPRIPVEIFTKFFYPSKASEMNMNVDLSDSDEEEGKGDVNTIENSSLMSASKNRDITN